MNDDTGYSRQESPPRRFSEAGWQNFKVKNSRSTLKSFSCSEYNWVDQLPLGREAGETQRFSSGAPVCVANHRVAMNVRRLPPRKPIESLWLRPTGSSGTEETTSWSDHLLNSSFQMFSLSFLSNGRVSYLRVRHAEAFSR